LTQLGDTSWAESFESGSALVSTAGSSSLGLIESGALEGSNVDLTEQLVRMITAQRNFQANAQIISTADTVTQTIINLR
jgi:flagellar hook protein FlgE